VAGDAHRPSPVPDPTVIRAALGRLELLGFTPVDPARRVGAAGAPRSIARCQSPARPFVLPSWTSIEAGALAAAWVVRFSEVAHASSPPTVMLST